MRPQRMFIVHVYANLVLIFLSSHTRPQGSMMLPHTKFYSALLALALFLLSAAPVSARNSHYSSATDLQISSQAISTASVGRDLILNTVEAEGKLSAGRNITCNNCTIGGAISAGKSISLNACNGVQNIAAGQDVDATHSQINQNVAAGHNVILHDTKVAQRISAGNEVAAEHSEIQGLITLGGHLITLDDSKATDILFSERSNNVGSGIVIGGNNVSTVKVGPSGLSAINGFTIKGAMNQTTVITPEQSIYVNGLKVSGEGPKSYQAYQEANPEAPTVYGPGWNQSGIIASQKATDGNIKKKPDNKPVINIVELRNGSILSGQVQFDSGYGKIIVYSGSQFLGTVVNGFVEKKPR